MPGKWNRKAESVIDWIAGRHRSFRRFAEANRGAIEDALQGQGPDAKKADPQSGVRAVVNIASEHIPSFCARSKAGQQPAYLNSYDLNNAEVRCGDELPQNHWKRRELVDHALSPLHGRPLNEVYFAAVELNGTGVRFYGDMCLVLQPVPSDTVVLDRNSYDLLRAPFCEAVEQVDDAAQRQAARSYLAAALSGNFGEDLKTMGAIKVLVTAGERDRRFSTGQISGGILDDEDYMEILKIGSFDLDGLAMVRLSTAEAALESQVRQRLQGSPPASDATRRWFEHRRAATQALADCNVDVAIVTTAGRVKG